MRSIPKLLVIDDDADTLGLLRTVLARNQYDATTASNWQEVTDRLQLASSTDEPYDLIILDLMMPERSGFDILRSLQVVLAPMPPVIILSAKNTVDDMLKARDLGAAKYLVKPTKPEKLIEAVRRVLGQTT